jgi:hypothetical protein
MIAASAYRYSRIFAPRLRSPGGRGCASVAIRNTTNNIHNIAPSLSLLSVPSTTDGKNSSHSAIYAAALCCYIACGLACTDDILCEASGGKAAAPNQVSGDINKNRSTNSTKGVTTQTTQQQAPGVRPGMPVYTRAEVAKHKSLYTGVWTTFGNGVYDITKFIENHPGLIDTIL